jgi:hypothetical protein
MVMKSKLHLHLMAFSQACKFGAIVFVGVAGVVGMVLIYAPDEVIAKVYYAAIFCGIASALIKYPSNFMRLKKREN